VSLCFSPVREPSSSTGRSFEWTVEVTPGRADLLLASAATSVF
jgi:hypothetical protein